MGQRPFAGADLAMPDGKQPELQDRLRTLSQRLEELSAVPAGAGHAEEFVALFQEKRRLETTLHAVPELRPRNQSVEYLPQNPHALAMIPRAFWPTSIGNSENWTSATGSSG